jgi:hypothetical protein
MYTYIHTYIHTVTYIHACMHHTYIHTYLHTCIHIYIERERERERERARIYEILLITTGQRARHALVALKLACDKLKRCVTKGNKRSLVGITPAICVCRVSE